VGAVKVLREIGLPPAPIIRNKDRSKSAIALAAEELICSGSVFPEGK
jgi:hypothetical protein